VSHAILTGLERPRLKRLRCKPAPLPVTVLYPHRQHLPRRLQAFIEWAATLLTVEMRLTSPTA
jgi:DNA-binding transcriptional LysR family regulator